MAQSSFETAPTRLNPRQFLCSRNPNREAAGQSRLWHATEKATVVSSLSSGWFCSVKIIHAILVERSLQRTVSFEPKIYKSTPRLSSSVKKPLDCWRSLMAWNRARQRDDCGMSRYVQIFSCNQYLCSASKCQVHRVRWCSLMFIDVHCFSLFLLPHSSVLPWRFSQFKRLDPLWILGMSQMMLKSKCWCSERTKCSVCTVCKFRTCLPRFVCFACSARDSDNTDVRSPAAPNFVKPRAKVEQSCQVTKTTKEVAKKWPRSEGIWHEIHIEKFSSAGPRWSRRCFRWCLKKFGIFPGSDESSRSSCPNGLVDPHFSAQSDFTPITNLYIKVTWNCPCYPCYPLFTFNMKHFQA